MPLQGEAYWVSWHSFIWCVFPDDKAPGFGLNWQSWYQSDPYSSASDYWWDIVINWGAWWDFEVKAGFEDYKSYSKQF